MKHTFEVFSTKYHGSFGWLVRFPEDHPGFTVHFRRVIMGYCRSRFSATVYKDDTHAPIHFWRHIADTLNEGIQVAADWLIFKWDAKMLPTIDLHGFQRGDICDLNGQAVVIVALYESVYDGGRDRVAFRAVDGPDRGVVVLPSKQLRLEARASIHETIAPTADDTGRLVIRFAAVPERHYIVKGDGGGFPGRQNWTVTAYLHGKPLRTWDSVPDVERSAIHLARVDALASMISLPSGKITCKDHPFDHFSIRGTAASFYITDWTGSRQWGNWPLFDPDRLPAAIADKIIRSGLAWSEWVQS